MRLAPLVRRAPGLSPRVHEALIDLVFASPGSVALSGAIAVVAIGVLAWTTADPILALVLLAGVTVAGARILIVGMYRLARGAADPLAWERRYEATSLLFSCVPAAACLRSFSLTADGGVHLLAAGLTIGYAGAIIGRAACRPRIALGQALVMLLPLAWACSWYDAVTYQALSGLLVLFALALASVALGLYEASVRTILTRIDREEVACALEAGNKALRAVESQRRQHAERFNAAVANMSQGLAMFGAAGALIVCNARYADLYGLPEHLRYPGTMLEEILAFRMRAGCGPADPDGFRSQHVDRATRGEPSVYTLPLQDGRTMRISHQPLPGGGWVTTHEDVTEAMRTEARIAHMARHDALTDLPNRVEFRDRLTEALHRVRRGESIAVLCLDLDRFKGVNDSLGHPVGDRLLVMAAERLRASVRDLDTVARLGGDEFAVVQVGAAQPTGATALAERMVAALSQPFEIDGHQISIGASVGIAVGPHDGREPDNLLRSADMALYRAKADGRGVFRFFEGSMDAAMQARRILETDLRLALARREFLLHYQPVLDLASGEVIAFEALLRWRHPERGMVPPLDFIGLAEEIGLIGPIGEWVLRTACADAASWPAPVRVAVNISPAQFRGRTLVAAVHAALAASGLPASRLELEITEAVLLENTESTLATLRGLKELGARIAMDDFGTGYSSLSYLRTFPFDKIKIDRSFVRNLPEETDSLAIVRAITGLGRSLGMVTTAEGVETVDQLDSLRAGGCGEVQGYLFSKPVPNDMVAPTLARLAVRPAA
ncbi:MAG TPA: EAL domain-containing protein [Salinarimonas sp.]|nr:EAL domain-containing protein [Salinarimonas sp.]